jgi:hypothetical protein
MIWSFSGIFGLQLHHAFLFGFNILLSLIKENMNWINLFLVENSRRVEGKKEKRAEERQCIKDKISSRQGKAVVWMMM